MASATTGEKTGFTATYAMFAVALLLGVAGLALLTEGHSGHTGQVAAARAQSQTPPTTGHPPAPSTPSVSPFATPSPSAAKGEDPNFPSEPNTDRNIQGVLSRTSRPDLPRAQERALVALASAIQIADLTGVGRERWPGYFHGETPTVGYTHIRIQAGIARRVTTADTPVDVTLIWAGHSPTGQQLVWQRAFIRLTWDGSVWQPTPSQ